MRGRRLKLLVAAAAAAVAAVLVLAVLSPVAVRMFWRAHASNPVRRGVARAAELGCFHCHGHQGRAGIPLPPPEEQTVPAWSGGVWMMYVRNDAQIRDYILNGSGDLTIEMPAYRDVLHGTDLEDLVAAFKALSGMGAPPADTPARRGEQLARSLGCTGCHGPAGSGGLPNPGSFTGFIPGWYGPDFEDLVRSRDEFDAWVRNGSSERIRDSAIASYFVRRQRVAMPSYPRLADGDLDALWAYVGWLEETGGGHHLTATRY